MVLNRDHAFFLNLIQNSFFILEIHLNRTAKELICF